MQVTTYCTVSWAGGCTERRAAFSRREYLLLFKDAGKLLVKMETALKNNCAFDNIVLKSYDIFMSTL